MSRNGIFLYFSYVFLLLSVPVHAQEVSIASKVRVIALDIHEVIADKNDKLGKEKIGRVRYWLGVAPFGIAAKFILAPLDKVCEKLGAKKCPCDGASIEGIVHAHPKLRLLGFGWCYQAAEDYADARYTISPETIALLKHLSKTYKIHVLSNIGPKNWAKLQARYPDVFNEDVVDGGIIRDYEAGDKPKPHLECYRQFEHKYQDELGEDGIILFWDDKQDNIDPLKELPRWVGARFKDLPQCKAGLKQMGFDIPAEKEDEDIALPVNA